MCKLLIICVFLVGCVATKTDNDIRLIRELTDSGHVIKAVSVRDNDCQSTKVIAK